VKSTKLSCCAALLLAAAATLASAQQFPTKNVTFIWPYPPAGSPYVAARLLADDLAARSGRAFVVDPRPGGGGATGMTALYRAEGDGHTIVLVSKGAVLVSPYVMPDLGWTPTSFAPVGRFFSTPIAIVSDPNFPAKTLGDLIRLAKDKPGTVSMAISGAMNRVWAAQIEGASGARFLIVPVTTVARNSIMGGHINSGFEAPSSIKGLAQEGKIRALAIGSLQRFAYMPDVPTIAETVPGIDATTWFAVLAPKGTPADRVAWLNREFNATLKKPEIASKIQEMAYDLTSPETPKAFEDYLAKEAPAYEKLIRDNKITN
jgi:tripartite-type tricarboxylate transporter receptor subunit TctC